MFNTEKTNTISADNTANNIAKTITFHIIIIYNSILWKLYAEYSGQRVVKIGSR